MTKRICHISAISIHSTRWMEAFRKKGYDVSLITDFQTWVPQKPRNVRIYLLPTLVMNNVHCRLVPNYISICNIIKNIKPDLVHLHVLHHYAPAVSRTHVPFILHSWGMEVLGLPSMNIFRKILSRYTATRAKKIIVDADIMRKIWVSAGIPQNKVEVIPFGVDTDMFNPKINGMAVRRTLGIKEDDIVIVSSRPFFPHYDLERLIKAIPIIVEAYKNVKFIIKGKGPLEGSIKELAKKLGVDRYVRFIRPVPYREVPRYLTAADIYVSTSFVDTTSVSLLEAMACGLPPLITDIAGNREWVKDGINGFLYPPKNHTALADKIIQLVDDTGLRKRFGENSRRIILEKASWDKCVSRMEAIYEELVRDRN